MPVHQRLRPATRRPTLLVATLNVAGQLAANTTVLAHDVVDQAVDVLALQEVKLGGVAVIDFVHRLNAAVAVYAAQRRQQHTGFVVRAAPNVAATASAGVLLLVRQELVDQGALDLRPEANTDFDWGGRLVSAGVTWGGHTLQLASVYCPNDPTPRAAFIRSSVAAAWRRRPQGSLFMGDWNFVPSPVRDRRHKRGQPEGDVHGDAGSAEALQRAAPDAVDVFRLKHPTAKSFTHFSRSNGHAARHDRFYCSPELAPHILSCRSEPSSFSDHDLVLCELLPILPPAAKGPGLPRARLDFMASPQHKTEVAQWLHDEVQGLPEEDEALLDWWPNFTRRTYERVRQANRAWRTARPPRDAEAEVQHVFMSADFVCLAGTC